MIVSSKIQESIEKSISEQLTAIISELSTDQIRFIIVRQGYSTDKEAAESIDIKPNTVYCWPPIVKEAVQLVAANGLIIAQNLRRRNLAKAMLVKTDGLDSDREGIQQRVATEIIEWEMGKAAQPVDGSIIVKYTGNVNPEDL